MEVALCAGVAAQAAHIKLAFVIGPLVATATFAMAGRPVYRSTGGRKMGQLVIGAAVGLNLTLAILLRAMPWVPLMVLSGLFSVLLCAMSAGPMATMARLDRTTAFFAMMPGGLAEMANTGARHGAGSEPVGMTHALRVALVVLLLPPVVVVLGHEGGIVSSPDMAPLPLAQTLLALAVAPLGAKAVRLTRLNNPWMLGGCWRRGA